MEAITVCYTLTLIQAVLIQRFYVEYCTFKKKLNTLCILHTHLNLKY